MLHTVTTVLMTMVTTLGIGVNNYWAGQNAKWTTQYTMDESNASGDITTISTQVQLAF